MTVELAPARLPDIWDGPFMGLARFTLRTLPRSSLRSILSIASWASPEDENVTNAKPRCFEAVAKEEYKV